MRKILVPSDLSKLSEHALKLAVRVANETNGHIDLVNFHKHPFGKTFSATGEIQKKVSDEENIYHLQLIRKNFLRLEQMAADYQTEHVSIEALVDDEDFDEGVERFIEENEVDLVVMGTTGEENAKEFFTGNHAQQVIELASCPVLTVRETDIIGDLSKIVVGVDFEKDNLDNYLKAVGYINDLAAGLKAKVHLVHVANGEPVKETNQKLVNFADNHGLINYETAVISSDSDIDGLLGYGHKINAGAVAVLTHADGGFFRVFEQNLSEELTKEADMPVLTINLHRV